MIIRKQFKGEMSHIVRNATAQRCSHSIHGHSFKVEFFIEGNKLDNAGMILDFHLLENIKALVDIFDHTHIIWDKDVERYRKFIKETNERWVEMNINPTAENLSLFFLKAAGRILKATQFNNNEGVLVVNSVIYHETDTGYAQSQAQDLFMLPPQLKITLSDSIQEEIPTGLSWIIEELGKMPSKDEVRENKTYFINPIIVQQCP